MILEILKNQTDDLAAGAGTVMDFRPAATGGPTMIHCEGNFGAGTVVTLKVRRKAYGSTAAGEWFTPDTDLVFSATGVTLLTLTHAHEMTAEVTGADGSTDVSLYQMG